MTHKKRSFLTTCIVAISLCLSTSLLAAPNYIVIQKNMSLLYPQASATAIPQHRAPKNAIFEIKDTTDAFYKIEVNKTPYWLTKSEASPFEGNIDLNKANLNQIVSVFETNTPTLTLATEEVPEPPSLDNTTPTENTEVQADVPTVPTVNSLPSPSANAVSSTPTTTIPSVATPDITTDAVSPTPQEPVEPTVSEPVVPFVLPTTTPTPDTEIYIYKNPDTLGLYPKQPPSKYPDLEIDGFYEVKYAGRDYNPKFGSDEGDLTVGDPRWDKIRNDPFYNKLPRDVLLGEPKLEMRFQFNIDGKLDDDLTVHYDIEQEPDFPGKYDIVVDHKNSELTFYHFDADFQNGDFITAKKALNGVKYQNENENWEFMVANGQQRSDPKKFETYGSGKTVYSLGARNLLFGSVKVWINNSLKTENVDYTINYYEGTVTFTRAINQDQYIEAVYEFTNPIEDFIPVLNRKNFFGFQGKWRSKTIKVKERLTEPASDTFSITEDTDAINGGVAFFMSKTPVELGSSIVKLNDEFLENNTDYFIKHDNGRLVLRNKTITPEDKITVSYKHYLTNTASEYIIGKDTNGPYDLLHPYLIDGSVSVFLNNVEKHEIQDYIIDYEKGQLYFNYKIEYPSVIEIDYTYTRVEEVTKASSDSPLEFGFSYLNESVNGEDKELVKSVPSENATVDSNADTITVANTPLTNTPNIRIAIDNTLLSSEFYTINPYTGVITVDSDKINSSSKAVVSYDYTSSFTSSIIFFGNESLGFVSPYESNIHFDLIDAPMTYQGIKYILYWDGFEEIRLKENESFTVDYGTDGTTVKITFLDEATGTPGLPPIKSSDKFTIVYDYSPEESPDPGDINQKMIGITVGGKIKDNWTINAELAMAANNFSKPQIEGSKTFTGTGKANDEYNLGNSNIVPDSESVFISGERINKDEDYFLYNLTGKLRFINLIPGPSDTIEVTYKYYDNSGITETGKTETALATKVSTEYKTDSATFTGKIKLIDDKFLPFTPLSGENQEGNNSFGGTVDWKFNKHKKNNDNLYLAYTRYERNLGENKIYPANETQWQHKDDLQSTIKLKLFDKIDTKHELGYIKDITDPVNTQDPFNAHPNDTLQLNYNLELKTGPENFRHTLYSKTSRIYDDYVDDDHPGTTETNQFSYKQNIKFKDLWLLGQTSIDPTYETTLTDKDDLIVQNDELETTTHFFSHNSRLNRGFKSTFKPFKKFVGKANYDISFVESYQDNNGSISESKTRLQNEYYEADYDPFKWLELNYNYSNVEDESPLNNQVGEITKRNNYAISRFSPEGMLTDSGLKYNHWLVRPIKRSYFTYNQGNVHTLKNNKLVDSNSWNEILTFNNFAPLKGLTFSKFTLKNNNSLYTNLVETSSVSSNITSTNGQNLSGGLTYVPQVKLLNTFKYTYNYEDREKLEQSKSIATSTTSNITTTEQPFFTRTQGLSYNPGKLKLKVPYLFTIDLGRFNASVTEKIVDSTDTTLTERYAKTDSLSGDPTTSSISQNNEYETNYTYKTFISPFNIFDLDTTYSWTDNRYSRNKNSSIGTTYRNIADLYMTGKYDFRKWLTFTGSAKKAEDIQYKSPKLNLSLGEIQNARDLQDAATFEEYIEKATRSLSIGTIFKPFSIININNSAKYERIYQTSEQDDFIQDTDDFETYTGTAGVKLFLGKWFPILNGFDIGYDYSVNRTYNDSLFQGEGYNGTTTATYVPQFLPFINKNNTKSNIKFNVKFNYTRVDSWGSLLNYLEQDESVKGTGETVILSVSDTNNFTQTGSLIADINIPLTNSPYVERLILSAEGYLKEVKDLINNNTNSYQLSGMLFKCTLEF